MLTLQSQTNHYFFISAGKVQDTVKSFYLLQILMLKFYRYVCRSSDVNIMYLHDAGNILLQKVKNPACADLFVTINHLNFQITSAISNVILEIQKLIPLKIYIYREGAGSSMTDIFDFKKPLFQPCQKILTESLFNKHISITVLLFVLQE